MKLREWLDQNGTSNTSFGVAIGRTTEAVRRYAAGDRVPDKDTMPLIVDATGGAVMPNDFFAISTGHPLNCSTCGQNPRAAVAACIRTDCPMASARQLEAA